MGKQATIEVSQEPMRINKTMVDKSVFIKEYKKQMRHAIKRIDPSITKEELNDVVNDMILSQGMSPGVGLDKKTRR